METSVGAALGLWLSEICSVIWVLLPWQTPRASQWSSGPKTLTNHFALLTGFVEVLHSWVWPALLYFVHGAAPVPPGAAVRGVSRGHSLPWHRVPRETLHSQPLEVSKVRLELPELWALYEPCVCVQTCSAWTWSPWKALKWLYCHQLAVPHYSAALCAWLSPGHGTSWGLHSQGPADWIQMCLLCIPALRKLLCIPLLGGSAPCLWPHGCGTGDVLASGSEGWDEAS